MTFNVTYIWWLLPSCYFVVFRLSWPGFIRYWLKLYIHPVKSIIYPLENIKLVRVKYTFSSIDVPAFTYLKQKQRIIVLLYYLSTNNTICHSFALLLALFVLKSINTVCSIFKIGTHLHFHDREIIGIIVLYLHEQCNMSRFHLLLASYLRLFWDQSILFGLFLKLIFWSILKLILIYIFVIEEKQTLLAHLNRNVLSTEWNCKNETGIQKLTNFSSTCSRFFVMKFLYLICLFYICFPA